MHGIHNHTHCMTLEKEATFSGSKPYLSEYKVDVTHLRLIYQTHSIMNQRQAHVVIVSFPTQGHIAPLMKLSHRIADRGVKVTFINTEAAHRRLQTASSGAREGIDLVSVPDGLEGDEERRNPLKLARSMMEVVPGHLRVLMERLVNGPDDLKISCVVADLSVWKALEVAKSMGIQGVGVWFAGAASLAFTLAIPKLIHDGIIDVNGNLIKDEEIKISDEIPPWEGREISWNYPNNQDLQKVIFQFVFTNVEAVKLCSWVLCNLSHELDPVSCNMLPQILPIGPLLATDHTNHSSTGNIWPEDSTSLTWLDQQAHDSVIYVAFGSITTLNQQQLDELARGLELTGRPFLWVIRAATTKLGASSHGKIVQWAPQEKVLAHPSVGVFLTHCGWNSIMEGLSAGVRFLCLPSFADQWHNKKYLCDVWKVGLGLDSDENKIVAGNETRAKVDRLFSDEQIKRNAIMWREKTIQSIGAQGSSTSNFENFIQHIKKW